MQNNKYLFTSESVSEGHPDKVCDRISDMVVDSYLSKDPVSRVACETLTTTNKVILAGETRGPKIDKDELITKVRDCIKDIGYDQNGFSWKTASIETSPCSRRAATRARRYGSHLLHGAVAAQPRSCIRI